MIDKVSDDNWILTVDPQDDGRRLSDVLRRELHPSQHFLHRLKYTPGSVTAEGSELRFHQSVYAGQQIDLALGRMGRAPAVIPRPLPLPILYESEDLLVVNKPAGMPAHPVRGHMEDTAANALAYRYGKEYVFRPVSRLDKDTSGCMLVARHALSSAQLNEAMAARWIYKCYLAIAEGKIPAADVFSLRSWLFEIPGTSRMRESRDPADASQPGAREALTDGRVLARSSDHRYALLSLIPRTGRTHQIRVQLAGVGCPLLGDSVYGIASEWLGHHALHARLVRFPEGKAMRTVCAPLPHDWIACSERLFGKSPEAFLDDDDELPECFPF